MELGQRSGTNWDQAIHDAQGEHQSSRSNDPSTSDSKPSAGASHSNPILGSRKRMAERGAKAIGEPDEPQHSPVQTPSGISGLSISVHASRHESTGTGAAMPFAKDGNISNLEEPSLSPQVEVECFFPSFEHEAAVTLNPATISPSPEASSLEVTAKQETSSSWIESALESVPAMGNAPSEVVEAEPSGINQNVQTPVATIDGEKASVPVADQPTASAKVESLEEMPLQRGSWRTHDASASHDPGARTNRGWTETQAQLRRAEETEVSVTAAQGLELAVSSGHIPEMVAPQIGNPASSADTKNSIIGHTTGAQTPRWISDGIQAKTIPGGSNSGTKAFSGAIWQDEHAASVQSSRTDGLVKRTGLSPAERIPALTHLWAAADATRTSEVAGGERAGRDNISDPELSRIGNIRAETSYPDKRSGLSIFPTRDVADVAHLENRFRDVSAVVQSKTATDSPVATDTQGDATSTNSGDKDEPQRTSPSNESVTKTQEQERLETGSKADPSVPPAAESGRSTTWSASGASAHRETNHPTTGAGRSNGEARVTPLVPADDENATLGPIGRNVQNLAIRVQDENQRRVDLRFTTSGDRVRLSVSSGDPSLANHLKTELNSLHSKLAAAGLGADLRPSGSAQPVLMHWLRALSPTGLREPSPTHSDSTATQSSLDTRHFDGGNGQNRHSSNWSEEIEDLSQASALRRLQKYRKDS